MTFTTAYSSSQAHVLFPFIHSQIIVRSDVRWFIRVSHFTHDSLNLIHLIALIICVIRANKMHFFLLIYFNNNNPLHVYTRITMHGPQNVKRLNNVWQIIQTVEVPTQLPVAFYCLLPLRGKYSPSILFSARDPSFLRLRCDT